MTTRELDFISDITKELIKDVVGQKIYLYPISEFNTLTNDVYLEATKKAFDNPIIVDALVDASTQKDTEFTGFGPDKQYSLEVFVQHRDVVEKGINITIGDFFSFGDVVYEITEQLRIKNIYGLAEHADGVKLVGTRAREDQIKLLMKGPTELSYSDQDAQQLEFVQQRGFESNKQGETADTRTLIEKGVLERPISGPHETSELGNGKVPSGNAFYGDG